MAEAAVSFAVETLGNLAIQKVAFLQGVEGQVNWLKDELKRMQSFLKDAAEKGADDERIRNWISDIRELAQEAEDVVDAFLLNVENPRRSRGLLGRCACFPQHIYHLDRLGQEIESIRVRLQAIDVSRQRYGIQDLGGGMNLSGRSEDGGKRQLTPWQKDKHLVGLERDVEKLIERAVLEKWEGLSVATIVGMGGIGKSTLAREVYNHAAVATRFDCRAWAVVSREFNPREIIKSLMLQLVKQEKQREMLEIMEKSDLQNVKNMLHQELEGKRYFVVVDDVWQDEAWESLAPAFPDEDKASRLLLTSRIQGIAKYARYNHKMNFLNLDESWELFLKKAFIDNINSKCPQHLEDIGRAIVEKCDGLPLAITVVGGLLVKKRASMSEWQKVLKGLESHSGSSEILPTLELSYHELPPQLKSCFLCLGFFKEDSIIRVSKLVNLWIAQGLIQQEGIEGEEKITREEIATSYLDELINRNMVQVKEMSTSDRVKTCYVHDLLHDLSIKKAKEEISFEILREGSSRSLDKARHLAVYCSAERSISGNSNTRLRSLFIRGVGIADEIPSYWKSFGRLRVLDFEDFEVTNLPDSIRALTWLRYLGLRNTSMKELPMSLGCLKNLEVLDIAKNNGIEVPNVIWKLAKLRCLYMSQIKCKLPLRMDTLKNLQTLKYIPSHNWSPEHATQLTSLYILSIDLGENLDIGELCTSLAKMENLVSLRLIGSMERNVRSLDQLANLNRLSKLKINYRVGKLPSASNFPPYLSYLKLYSSFLREDPMPVLQQLPQLLYLNLVLDSYVGHEMVISRDGFPRLRVLSLNSLSMLKNIQLERSAMLELNRLEIIGCPLLESLPEELRFMTNLKELKLETTPQLASKLQGVNSHIISNIPSVELIISEWHGPSTELALTAALLFIRGIHKED
ncbi:putative disease resistance protein At1g50180 isoform X1 [Sesamum indicum]|uniref:Disease resistance protein At1g50180 isoform X1 n=1 Tax=Sesamum indicum TaxID=4182 RepID=A0A6I9T0S9_SESIN|nr:putative disease resistance protein At1g50180 isoform X1 [Sesamum indicum]